MFECIAKDKMGVPRVYGCDVTPQKAETQCRWELMNYLQRRREMDYEDFTFETGAA